MARVRTTIAAVCATCGKEFMARCRPLDGEDRFCSRRCSGIGFHRRHPVIPLRDRFWSHVHVVGEACWAWTGATIAGYGTLGRGVRGEGNVLAHRVSWEIHFGPIPDGMCVLHRCDNPPCTRPDHLFLGTRADNVADMDAKGRRSNVPRRHVP